MTEERNLLNMIHRMSLDAAHNQTELVRITSQLVCANTEVAHLLNALVQIGTTEDQDGFIARVSASTLQKIAREAIHCHYLRAKLRKC